MQNERMIRGKLHHDVNLVFWIWFFIVGCLSACFMYLGHGDFFDPLYWLVWLSLVVFFMIPIIVYTIIRKIILDHRLHIAVQQASAFEDDVFQPLTGDLLIGMHYLVYVGRKVQIYSREDISDIYVHNDKIVLANGEKQFCYKTKNDPVKDQIKLWADGEWECPVCHGHHPYTYQYCPECGTCYKGIRPSYKKRHSWLLWAVIVLLLVAVLLVVSMRPKASMPAGFRPQGSACVECVKIL